VPTLTARTIKQMSKPLRHFLVLSALAFVAGCASIDFDYPKSESLAFTDTGESTMGRAVAEIVAQHPPEQSGFYPVFDGIDSLALRLLMAERAERSIDAQYFLIHDDLVGSVFINSLLRAANRGVRVRLLVDDIQLKGYDAGMAALDSHENFELRIFNPFAHRKARALDVTSLSRVSRRMHNKSFTVDNQMTLIGGRNIADEYFDAKKGERFGDLDVLAIGSIVPKVSAMFDSYWNHRASLPMPAIAEVPENADEALATLHERVSKSLEEVDASEYADAVRSSILDYVHTDSSAFTWAEYDLVFDSPDKSNPDFDTEDGSIIVQMRAGIGDIEQQLFVVTPYFVLTKDNIEGFRGLRDRNIDITVLTNSLASNNHSVSHSGYAPNRKRLLQMGVNLFELRANTSIAAEESKGVQESKSTLHAKAFSVDRKRIFIGSFNWNQRSANLDTELGVIIHSPEMATALVERVTAGLPEHSFMVFLNEDGKLRWKGQDNGQEVILTKEPQTSAWHRFSAGFLRIAPNSQL
jgi:putative cardiolipin synthase